jgi:hypothetical protein
MSDAEIREWCEGGERSKEYLLENADLPDCAWGLPTDELEELRESGEYHRGPIPAPDLPPDPGLKLRQLQALLEGEVEFETRWPEAYRVLYSSPHPNSERDVQGLYLPSFGCRIARSAPQTGTPEGWWRKPTDVYSATPEVPEVGRPIDQRFLPLNRAHLRGLISAILGREEYVERVVPPGERDHKLLLEGVGPPSMYPVRLTDLRLAADLPKPDGPDEKLRPLLEELERPITSEGVVRWKRRVLEKHSDPTKGTIGKPDAVALIASFAAAALFLFMDLDMPGVRDKKSFRLAEKVESLANMVRKASETFDAFEEGLEALVADRAAGGQRHPEGRFVYALRLYRMGYNARTIAEWWGITPYDSKTGKGSRDWKKKVARILAHGVEVEREAFPEAAAVFANMDDPDELRMARLAYRAHITEMSSKELGQESPWGMIGTTLRIDTGTARGREVALSYVQLGCCLKKGINPLP